MNDLTQITWQPMIDAWAIALIAFLALSFIGYISWVNKRIAFFRFLFVSVLILLMLNPVLKRVSGTPTDTIINVLMDRTDSQKLAGRDNKTDEIETAVLEKLSDLDGVDVQVQDIDHSFDQNQTLFLPTLKNMLNGQNPKQVGGSVLITDGRFQDPSAAMEQLKNYGPVHVIMTGDPENEFDRRIKIVSAPEYVVVGDTLPVELRVDEFPNVKTNRQTVRVYLGDSLLQSSDVKIGETSQINIPVDNPGQMMLRFVVGDDPSELSAVNNTAILNVQGVRARLKVLLVSGQPHQGLRIWRNLLKSDPAVDLVHFTILRSFDSIDITPPDQLALIPFPTEELFQERIKDFDLIIFDRYTRRNILLPQYFDNIVSFVNEGGGLLMVHGPEEANQLALSDTSLLNILPYTRIEGAVKNNGFKPELSAFGQRHPITSSLTDQNQWGKWGRYISMDQHSASSKILMTAGKDKTPLLIVDQVGEGRIAQFTSEQIWLWARGYKGGGPYGTIMKRLAHWLMKEPTLDYKPLKIEKGTNGLLISYNGDSENQMELSIELPNGEELNVTPDIQKSEDGLTSFQYQFETDTPGFYTARYDGEVAHFILGQINSAEYQNLVSDYAQSEVLTNATAGNLIKMQDSGGVEFDLTSSNRFARGNTALFKTSTEIENKTVKTHPLLPWWLAALFGFIFLTLGWLRQE